MEYLKDIYDSIISSTNNIEELINLLKDINGNTLCIGTGGSHVVAEYANLILSRKNSLIATTIDTRDLNYIDTKPYDNVFCVSYSGSNFGVKYALLNNLNKYLLTSRKTKVKDEVLLHYDLEQEHSFISIKATLIPMAILLKYYLGEDFIDVINDIFKTIDSNLELNNISSFINIFSGIETKASCSFLESSLTESGIAVSLIHEKYSYCHGRSTINKSHDGTAIYLGYNGSDLDKTLVKVIDLQMPNNCILKNVFQDPIVNEFYTTIQLVCILKNIAERMNIDLKNIKYDKEAIKMLYYFKGTM